jgi:hypothetical protein
MTWNAYIDIKANGKLNDAHWEEVKKWAEVEQIWSKQGNWDWLVKLRASVNSLDALEKIVFHLRSQAWVSETHTWWAKAI